MVENGRDGRGATPQADGVRIDRLFALASGLLAGLVYLLTMARTISFWDSGEFVACAWIAGIPHPPCVPLFVLMGRFFAIILPFIPEIAVRINLMCVLAGGLSMGILARLVQRWSMRMNLAPAFYRPVSLAAGLLAGLSFTVWQNNNATETYALSQFIALLAIWVFDIWIVRNSESKPGNRHIFLVLYLLTLAIAVHLAALIAVPGIAAIYLLSAARRRTTLWRNPRFLLTALGLMTLAFSVHLYMPIRAVQRPEINETDPSNWSAFRSALAREQYGTVSVFDRKGPVPDQIAQYFRYLSWQSGQPWSWTRIIGSPGRFLFIALRFVATIAAIWGGILLWQRNRRVFLLIGAIFFMSSVFFIFYLNFKTGPVASPTGEVRERDYFYADSFALFAVFAAFGAGSLLKNAFKKDQAVWAVMLLPVASLVGNYFECDRSGDVVARDYGINLLESCTEGAVLITNGDNDTFPLWFAQSVLGVRRDVIVSNLSLMNTDWYVHQLLDRDPSLVAFGELGLVDSLRPVFIWGPHFFHVTRDGMPALSELDSRMLRAVFPQAWPWAITTGDLAIAIPTESYGVQGSLGMQDLVMLSMILNRPVHGRDIFLAGTVSNDSRVFVEPYLEMRGIAFRVSDRPGVDMIDPAESWRLVDSYGFNGLDDPGIFKDDQAVQLMRNYVSAYHKLAYYHLITGQPDSMALALNGAESLFTAMPDQWMQILPSHALLKARLIDGLYGPDSTAAYILDCADSLSTFAASTGDSRLAQTSALFSQIALDFQRESQFRSYADSIMPGTAEAAWLQIEVDLLYGNYLAAWDRLRTLEASSPEDPLLPLLSEELGEYMETTPQTERFELSESALATVVQLGDTAETSTVLEAMNRLLAADRAASAAVLGYAMAGVTPTPSDSSFISLYAGSIVDDPARAMERADWFLLESARVQPGVLAWECAVMEDPALCYAALADTPDPGPALEALVRDPRSYLRRIPCPDSDS